MKRLCLCLNVFSFWYFFRDNFLRKENSFDLFENEISSFEKINNSFILNDKRSDIEMIIGIYVQEKLYPIAEIKRFWQYDVFL